MKDNEYYTPPDSCVAACDEKPTISFEDGAMLKVSPKKAQRDNMKKQRERKKNVLSNGYKSGNAFFAGAVAVVMLASAVEQPLPIVQENIVSTAPPDVVTVAPPNIVSQAPAAAVEEEAVGASNIEEYVCYIEDSDRIWAYMSASYLTNGTISLSFNGSGIFNGAWGSIEGNTLDGSGGMGQVAGDGFEQIGPITVTSFGDEVVLVVYDEQGQEKGTYTFVKQQE